MRHSARLIKSAIGIAQRDLRSDLFIILPPLEIYLYFIDLTNNCVRDLFGKCARTFQTENFLALLKSYSVSSPSVDSPSFGMHRCRRSFRVLKTFLEHFLANITQLCRHIFFNRVDSIMTALQRRVSSESEKEFVSRSASPTVDSLYVKRARISNHRAHRGSWMQRPLFLEPSIGPFFLLTSSNNRTAVCTDDFADFFNPRVDLLHYREWGLSV